MELPRHFGPRYVEPVPERDGFVDGYERIRVGMLSPTIGGEVEGVDLRKPLEEDTLKELRGALLQCRVIFLRNQPITPQEQVAFARRFGELEEHPFLPEGDAPEVIRFSKDAQMRGVENIWHSDVSWREIPSLGSILHAVEVPEVGGDTLWADMAAAWRGLPDAVRDEIDGLEAVHDFSHSFGLALPPDELKKKQEEFPPAIHPVVRTHPETGEKILYVNAIFTSHIVGMERFFNDTATTEIYTQASIPEYQVRFRWEKDVVAFWDNRSTQHYASSDYWPKPRVMDRVTVIGERPV